MTEAGRRAIAVAETAHYTLLQQLPSIDSNTNNNNVGTAMSIAELWLQVLENALNDNSLSRGNARRAAWEPLLQSLAQQLQRYQDQSWPQQGEEADHDHKQ